MKQGGTLSLGQKISFGLGDAGCVMAWTLVSSFLTIYYTDDVGISAATVAIIMLSVRIFDGFSDLLMGYLLDITNSKHGKARPWIMYSAPLLAIFLILCFSVPAFLGETGKVIYAFLTYFILTVIIYTACNLSYCALQSFITESQQDRISMNSIRFFFTNVLTVILSFATPIAAKHMGWLQMCLIYGVIAVIMLWTCVFVCKETVKPKKKDEGEKYSVVESVKSLAKNKYFLYILSFFAITYIILGISGSGGMYMARYILGDDVQFGNIVLATKIATILACVCYPFICNMLGGKWRTIIVGFFLIGVGFGLCGVFAGTHLQLYTADYYLFLLSNSIQGIGRAFMMAGLFAMLADIVDYGEWKTGKRVEGMTYSVSSFGFKIGMGVGGAGAGFLLSMVNYDATLAVQPEETLEAILWMNSYVPSALGFLGFIIAITSNIDKVMPQVLEDLKNKKN